MLHGRCRKKEPSKESETVPLNEGPNKNEEDTVNEDISQLNTPEERINLPVQREESNERPNEACTSDVHQPGDVTPTGARPKIIKQISIHDNDVTDGGPGQRYGSCLHTKGEVYLGKT